MNAIYAETKYSEFYFQAKAAKLVGRIGTASLPPPIGDCQFESINPGDARFGLPMRHPLHRLYPSLKVSYYALVVEERFKVERDRVRGLALYADFNQTTGMVAGVHSWNGRNALAPYNWMGAPGEETDPAGLPQMEWRTVTENRRQYVWQNHMFHGQNPGKDWIDGVPDNLENMHSPNGKVHQMILVPKGIPGLGVAEQTLQPGEVNALMSVLLFDITEEGRQAYNRSVLSQRDSRRGYPQSYSKGGGEETYRSAPVLRGESFQSDQKIATGGCISQWFMRNPCEPQMWNSSPTALIVVVPVSEQMAAVYFGGANEGRLKF